MSEPIKQQNNIQPNKKTGFKAAVKCILIGIGLFFLYPLIAMEVQKSGGNPDSIIPFFVLPSALLIIYGFCKLVKIMWDNIPE